MGNYCGGSAMEYRGTELGPWPLENLIEKGVIVVYKSWQMSVQTVLPH